MSIKFEYKAFTMEAKERVMHMIVTGKLEKEDYNLFVPEAENRIKKYGKIRIMIELVDFKGWSAGALWEECKLAYHHLKDIERMAMVGDKTWEKNLAMFMKPFTGAKLKYFDVSKRQAAIDWIEQDIKNTFAA